MLLGDLVRFNEAEWRQQSRDLQALSLGDFEPVRQSLAALFPNTQMPLRAIPFVQRYVAELTGRYARPVVRRFRATDLGQGFVDLRDAYTDAGLDEAFDAVERALVVQRSLILLPVPDADGILRLYICHPWQVQAEYTDPADATRPGKWSRLTIQVPMSFAAEQVIYGQVVITPEAAWRTVAGGQVGLYDATGINPWLRIPAVCVTYGDAYPGRWHGPVNQAVLNLQTAICAQVSDNEIIIRNCAFPQKVIENAEPGQRMEHISIGPDKFLQLDSNGTGNAQPTLRIVQGAVPVTELSNAIDNQIRLYCAMLGLDPSPFLKSNTATTASARLFAAQDRQALQDRIKPTLLKAETEVARLWAEWMSMSGLPALALPYRSLRVEVTYTETAIVADPLHDAQALQLRIDLDLMSKAEVVASERGISVTDAQRIVDKNRKDRQAQEPVTADLQTELPAPGAATDSPNAAALATVAGADVAATALNGAQVESLVNIINLVTTGQLDAEAAKILIGSAFPTLAESQVSAMVSRSVSFTPAAPVAEVPA